MRTSREIDVDPAANLNPIRHEVDDAGLNRDTPANSAEGQDSGGLHGVSQFLRETS